MNAFIEAAISRSRTTLLIMVMVVLAGLISRSVIPVANEPDIDVPFFVITVIHEGITPEDAERSTGYASRDRDAQHRWGGGDGRVCI